MEPGTMLEGRRMFIRSLSPSSQEVYNTAAKQPEVLKTVSFPAGQASVFDLLMAGKNMEEAETEYKAQAEALKTRQERLLYLPEESRVRVPASFSVRKKNGENGYLIEFVKEVELTLPALEKVHPLSDAEVKVLARDMATALANLLKAGFSHGHVCAENIVLEPGGHYALNDAALQSGTWKDDQQALLALLKARGLELEAEEAPWKLLSRLEAL